MGLALLQGLVSLHDVWDLRTVYNYDTASYFVVARNFALGRGLIDTNLWHYLAPESVPHPAGDHWPVGWPLILGALMRVFGHSERAALLITATLSTLLPVGVFALTRAVRASAGLAVPLLAGLLVIFQGRLYQTNVTTDVTMPYALSVLGGLVGAFHLVDRAAKDARPRRAFDAFAGLLLTAPLWLRGEAFFLPLAFAPTLLWARGARAALPLRARRLAWLLVGVAAGQLLLGAYNLAAFGRVVPLTRSLTPWMTSYGDLYFFLTDPSRAIWQAQGAGVIVAKIRTVLADHGAAFFHQLPWMLPVSALIGAVLAAWRRDSRAWTVTLFVLLTWLVQGVLVPVIANANRTVMNATPCLCVLAALAVAPLLDAGVVRSHALPRCSPPVGGPSFAAR